MKKILPLTLVFFIAMTGFVYAADPMVREYRFTTTNKDYKHLTLANAGEGELAEIERDIEVDGKRYKAVSLTFTEEKQNKPVKQTQKFTGLSEKKVPDRMTTKSGSKLKLSDVKWTEHTRQAATGTTTYTGTSSRPNAPETKKITASLPDGRTITVTGQLQRVERTGSSYNKPFKVTARFIGDKDVAYYKLGNTKIPNNPRTPTFAGYQDVILNHLGYNPDRYRITAGKWTSDYQIEDGRTVRYAEFSGLQSTADWTAFYREVFTADSPQAATYDAVAEYTNGVDETSYEVVATVTYTYEETGLTLLQKILLASAAVIVIACLIAAVLLILRKKREKGEETVTRIKEKK